MPSARAAQKVSLIHSLHPSSILHLSVVSPVASRLRTHAGACGKLRERGLYQPRCSRSIKFWMHPHKDKMYKTLGQACLFFLQQLCTPFIISVDLQQQPPLFAFVERPLMRRLMEDCLGMPSFSATLPALVSTSQA